MATVAELKAIASLDGKQFQGEIAKMGNSVQQFGSRQLAGLKGMIAGAFSLGAVVQFGRHMLETAHQMELVGDATNLSMGSMVAMKTLAATSGLDFDQMSRALGKVRNAQGDVVKLSEPMIEALKRLGITAEEFISLPVDEALEKIGQKYTESGGNAVAFNAVCDIFGERIGPRLMTMLKNLADEGLVNLKKRTEDATQGFKDLAEARSHIEEFKAGAELKAGKAAGTIMEEKAALDRLVTTGGIWGVIKRFFTKTKGPVFGIDEWTGQPVEKPPTSVGALPPVPPEKTPEQIAYEANQKAVQDKLEKKRSDIMVKGDERRDQISREQDKIQMDFMERQKDILAGRGISAPEFSRVDALQRVGGIIGGVAGGDQAARRAERALKIAEESKALQQEFVDKLAETNRKLDELGGVD